MIDNKSEEQTIKTFKDLITSHCKEMHISDNSLFAHTLSQHFTTTKDPNELWALVITEFFDFFGNQLLVRIESKHKCLPIPVHNTAIIEHVIPFIQCFHTAFTMDDSINNLLENGFLDTLVPLERNIIHELLAHFDGDTINYPPICEAVLEIHSILFQKELCVKQFLKDYSNVYPTIVFRFREISNITERVQFYAQSMIDRIYSVARQMNPECPFLQIIRVLTSLPATRKYSTPTYTPVFSNTGSLLDEMPLLQLPSNHSSPIRTQSSPLFMSNIGEIPHMPPLPEVKNDIENSPSLTEVENHIKEIQLTHSEVSLNNFELLRFLGQGGCGTVFLAKAKNLPGGETYVALKIIDQNDPEIQQRLKRYKIERNLMVVINNPFIITLHYAFTTSNNLYLAMQYCPGGDMFHYLSRQHKHRLHEPDVRFYCAEVLLALKCLHENAYVYRDLKPENILISESGHLVLGDFDLSMSTDVDDSFVRQSRLKIAEEKSLVGTLEYISPEVAQGLEYDERTDWWGFGILLYEVTYGKPPFGGEGHQLLVNICSDNLEFPPLTKKWFHKKKISTPLKDVISKLLVKDPSARLTDPLQIEHEPFFQSIDFNNILKIIPPFVPPPDIPEDYSTAKIDFHDYSKPAKADTFIRIDNSYSSFVEPQNE